MWLERNLAIYKVFYRPKTCLALQGVWAPKFMYIRASFTSLRNLNMSGCNGCAAKVQGKLKKNLKILRNNVKTRKKMFSWTIRNFYPNPSNFCIFHEILEKWFSIAL